MAPPFFRKFLLPLPNASLPLFLLTCGTGRVEDGEEGDAYVSENGFPEAGEPDHAEDHEQPLDAERHDDVLPDDHAGLGGDGEHFRQARGRVVQNDRVRHFNGRFRTEAAHCHADTGHGEYRGVVDAVAYKKYGLTGAERFQLGGLAFGKQPGAVPVEMQFLGDDGGAFGAIAVSMTSLSIP